MSEIKSVDVIDTINHEDLLKEFITFLCEKDPTLTMLYFYDMISKPYKYVDVFNEFFQFMNLTYKVVA